MAELVPEQILASLARDARLRVFLRDGKVELLPAKRSRRLQLLDEVAQAFEPGIRYPEREVDRRLGAIHADYCALRRYLVDERRLDRDHGEYWRVGGPDLTQACYQVPNGTAAVTPSWPAGAASSTWVVPLAVLNQSSE
jgi:hypothetical protein